MARFSSTGGGGSAAPTSIDGLIDVVIDTPAAGDTLIYVEGPQRTNLIKNPNFDIDTSGWDAVGFGVSISRTSSQYYSGTHSVQVTSGFMGGGLGYSNPSPSSTPLLPLTPNTSYTLSAWVKGTAGQVVSISFSQSNSSGMFIDGAYGTATLTGSGWQRVSVTDTTQASADRGFLSISPPMNQSIYVDAVQLEVGTTATEYFDGSTPGASWATIAGSSTSTIVDPGSWENTQQPEGWTGSFPTNDGYVVVVNGIITEFQSA